MTDLDRQLREDRALRNAAKALIIADYEHIRADLHHKGFGERIADRLSEGAIDIFEEAIEVADNNRGVLAALAAAIVLWFARNPIMSLFFGDRQRDEYREDAEQEQRPPRSNAIHDFRRAQ